MEWKPVALGNVAEVQSGGTPLRTMSEYWGGDLPWYSSGELNTSYTCDPKRTITEAGLNSSNAKLYPKGSLLIGMYDTAALKMSILDREAAFNQAIAGVKPNANIDLKFIMASINNSKAELLALRRGVRQKNLNLKKIKNISILLPPLPEQKRIVAILDEAFEGIDAAIAITKKNLTSARELFDSYLNDVFTKKGEGWETEELNKHVKFIDYRGKTPPKVEEGIRLITAKNVKQGYVQRAPEEFIDPEVYDSWMTRGFPRRGDVLFTTEAPLGNVAQLDTDEKVVIGQRLITMQPEDEIIDKTFLKYALRSSPNQKEIIGQGTGATVLGIKSKLLKKIPISFPSLPEQVEIVAKLDSLAIKTKSIETIYQQKLDYLNELKQSLLAKAFSGELTAQPEPMQKEAVG